MLNWKYPAAAIFAVAAIVPSLCQTSRTPIIGRAFANQHPRTEIAANISNTSSQPKAQEGKLITRKSARAVKELHIRKKNERNGEP